MTTIIATKKKDFSAILSIAFMLLASTFLSGSMFAVQSAEAALCPLKSNGHNRCYAVDEYSTFPSYTMKGLKGKNTVYDNNVAQGFVASSNWVLFDNQRFIEVFWKDDYGTNDHSYFGCAVNGHSQSPTPWGSPSHGTEHTFEVSDTDGDGTWSMTADGTTCLASDLGGKAYVLKTGYETNYDNNAITNNDYNTLQVFTNGYWYMWQGAPIGGHGSNPDTGFFVKNCGTGSEQYYHHVHGKGTPPANC